MSKPHFQPVFASDLQVGDKVIDPICQSKIRILTVIKIHWLPGRRLRVFYKSKFSICADNFHIAIDKVWRKVK